MKKTLSILLALMMTVSVVLVPMTAFADNILNSVKVSYYSEYLKAGVQKDWFFDIEDEYYECYHIVTSSKDTGLFKKSGSNYEKYKKKLVTAGEYAYYFKIVIDDGCKFSNTFTCSLTDKKFKLEQVSDGAHEKMYRVVGLKARNAIDSIFLTADYLPSEIADTKKVKNLKAKYAYTEQLKLSGSYIKIEKAYFIKDTKKWLKAKPTKDKKLIGKYYLVVILKSNSKDTDIERYCSLVIKAKNERFEKYSCAHKKIDKDSYAFCIRIKADSVTKKNSKYNLNNKRNGFKASLVESEKARNSVKGKTVVIPKTVKAKGVGSLKVKMIDWFGFSYTDIKGVVIPKTVTEIGYYAFEYCTNLSSVKIPKSVTRIGYSAFADCRKLSSVNISKNVKKIDGAPFRYNSKLKKINVEKSSKNFKSVDGVLYNKKMTVLIQYPAGKKDKKFKVPSSVKKIDVAAFEGCKYLTEVSIPKSVQTIAAHAFESCPNLKVVKLEKGIKLGKIGERAFGTYYNKYYERKLSGVKVYYKNSEAKKRLEEYNKLMYKGWGIKNCINIKKG